MLLSKYKHRFFLSRQQRMLLFVELIMIAALNSAGAYTHDGIKNVVPVVKIGGFYYVQEKMGCQYINRSARNECRSCFYNFGQNAFTYQYSANQGHIGAWCLVGRRQSKGWSNSYVSYYNDTFKSDVIRWKQTSVGTKYINNVKCEINTGSSLGTLTTRSIKPRYYRHHPFVIRLMYKVINDYNVLKEVKKYFTKPIVYSYCR